MHRTSAIMWRAILAAIGFAGLAMLCAGPETTAFRFAGNLRPYADAIFGQTGPVDIVFVGTSRVMRSVMADQLAPLIAERIGQPVVIYDFAISGAGFDTSYVLLREMLERHPTRLVVIEYRWEGQSTPHGLFSQIATWRDLIQAPAFSNRAALARAKLGRFMTVMAEGEWFHLPERPAGPSHTHDPSTPYGPAEHRMRKAIAAGRAHAPTLPVDAPGNAIQDIYAERIVTLARAKGSNVVFLLMPGLDERAVTPAERDRLHRRFGTGVIGLTDEELARFGPHDYADENHFGWRALPTYLPMLADWLTPWLAQREMVRS